MPTYEYQCHACKHREDQVRPIADRDNAEVCRVCKQGVMDRDVIASMQPHTDKGYDQPIYSHALAVPPYQIAEAKRQFPHHEFHPDGRMIIRSHTEHKRVLKELGFFNKD